MSVPVRRTGLVALRLGALPVFALAFAAACGDDDGAGPGLRDAEAPGAREDAGRGDAGGSRAQAEFKVDATVQPARERIAGIDGGDPRPLASVRDGKGRQADFVADEMIAIAENDAELQTLLDRWDGTLLRSIPTGDGEQTINLVRVDPSDSRPAALPALLEQNDPNNRGEYRFSSDEALSLMAAVAEEQTKRDRVVALNWVLPGHEVQDRSTAEAPMKKGEGGPTYDPDAFTWPYMSRGSAQDTGTAEAWRLLVAAERTGNRSTLAILDGGFSMAGDYAGSPRMIPATGWDTENPSNCSGGNPCPWHGTFVATTALGAIDNERMAAGSGGPVADGVFVQMPANDFFAYVDFALDAVPDVLGSQASIINISAGAGIPAGLCAIGACAALDAITALVRAAGTLIVASAGNDGRDVDEQDCFLGICWEGEVVAPCELAGVICVGGLDWNSTARDPDSNYGSNAGADSVDIYAPFTVWVGADPDDDPAENVVNLVSGTSFSAPFVAGVLALIRAADPTLSADEVADILLQTAHTDSRSREVRRRVNAYEAVRRALGGNAPPYFQITAPHDGDSYSVAGRVDLSVMLDDDGAATPTVTWTSDRSGAIGEGTSDTVNTLPIGEHVITATVDDGPWTLSRSVSITLENDPPTVSILLPMTGASYYESSEIPLAGVSVDMNNAPTFTLEDSQVGWYVDGATSPIAMGHAASIPGGTLSIGSHTLRFSGSDGMSSASATVEISVMDDPINLPPTADIYDSESGTSHPSLVNLGYAGDMDDMGYYRQYSLYGRGTDPEFGNLTGPSLEWSITSEQGTAVPDSGTGTALLVRFYPNPGVSTANFTVTLTAIDTDDNTVRTTDTVVFQVHQLI